MLQEPAPSKGDLRFRLLGIPVRISPWFWAVTVMLGLKDTTPQRLLIWVVAVFVSILWHEMGHALVIRGFGFRPWVTLYGMGGLASYNPGEHRRFRGLGSLEQILISLAGPGAGFALAALLVAGIYAAGHGESVRFIEPFHVRPVVFRASNVNLAMLFNDISFVCVFWGLVNLLPVYPLDGGHIARELFLRFNLRDGIRQSLILSIVTAIGFGIYAAAEWRDAFILIFFAWLAFNNYQVLQAYSGRGRW